MTRRPVAHHGEVVGKLLAATGTSFRRVPTEWEGSESSFSAARHPSSVPDVEDLEEAAIGSSYDLLVDSANVGCIGDCTADGSVTIEELITGVNIALGSAPLTQCPVFDMNGSASVTIDELILAVSNALDGCD